MNLSEASKGLPNIPSGLDTTPDGSFAYVGDAARDNDKGYIWRIDLFDGSRTQVTYDLACGEGGVFCIAVLTNGDVFFTTSDSSSGMIHENDFTSGEIID